MAGRPANVVCVVVTADLPRLASAFWLVSLASCSRLRFVSVVLGMNREAGVSGDVVHRQNGVGSIDVVRRRTVDPRRRQNQYQAGVGAVDGAIAGRDVERVGG